METPVRRVCLFAGQLVPSPTSSPAEKLPFAKVLIANRGEIAVRVARACKELGLRTAGIYAKEDAASLHVYRVDEAIEVKSQNPGPIAPYLDVAAVVAAAKSCGAEAVHPGYGFLSESAEFASACAEAGLVFIGPKGATIAQLGNKVEARELAERSGVPVLKGTPFIESAEDARRHMVERGISFPIIFKAAFGGGGRGMRLVESDGELEAAYNGATSEARTAFGNGAMFFEEFLRDARHIEVQIVADGQGGVAHLFERDCSVQIRNQKVVEVAPARMHPELRRKITDCAVRLVGNCDYQGVGTVEFMVAASPLGLNDPDARFVFMEVNPRIQVEHTITEEVTGVDIVKTQLRIAGGARLGDLGLPGGEGSAAARLRGFAIQARVSLAPGGGKEVTVYREPSGDGVRVDGALYKGCKPSVFYDPLVGKLICYAPGEGDSAFEACRQLMLQALDSWDIQGVNTNKPLMRGILTHPEFINNEVLLSFMARHGATLAAAGAAGPSGPAPAAAVAVRAGGRSERREVAVTSPNEATVVEVRAREGQEVRQGDAVVVLSAMKLEIEVPSPFDGTVRRVSVAANATVAAGQELLVLDAFVDNDASAGAAAAAPEAARRRSPVAVGAADPTALWRGPEEGVAPCMGPSSSSLRLPAPKVDETFARRLAKSNELRTTLQQRLEAVRAGGPAESVRQHLEKKKMLPRDRIYAVIDPGTQFLEFSALAAFDMYDGGAASANIVTGVGLVHGREVLFVANDATVKGGTYYPMTVKKHLRAQLVALQNHLPCVYLVDSGGAFLPLQDEVFPDQHHFGRIFFNQANLSQQGLPQISVVCGSCTAGGAYVPAMSDENVIVKGNGTIFLGGPPLVKASTGEDVTAEELGGAHVHTEKSGVADHFAEDEPHALRLCREILAHCGEPAAAAPPDVEPEAPLYNPEELLGLIPEDNSKAFDVRQVIARIADGSRFHEFKARFGATLVCGFTHVHGYAVGIVANNGILFGESAQKGAHFVQLCGQRRVPLLFLQNITGFMVGKSYEHGGIARDGAKMVTAVACVDVPKITIIVGGSHGAGNYGMCGRAYDPRFLFMWPNARISVMGGAQAADVLATVKNEQLVKRGSKAMEGDELEAFRRPTLEKYEREGSPYHSTARLWDDGIIDPRDTRHVLGLCLRICSRNPGKGARSYGVFRM